MHLKRKWDEIMGPKDERLEAEENKSMKVGYYILLFGTLICLWYWICLNQVADVTDNPLYTALGDNVISVGIPLSLIIIASAAATTSVQLKSGAFSSYKRFADIDRIPWGFVCLIAVLCGVLVFILACGMRILAEIQIVGIENVEWFGDIAIGLFLGGIGFIFGMAASALCIHDAIKQRKKMEAELEE